MMMTTRSDPPLYKGIPVNNPKYHQTATPIRGKEGVPPAEKNTNSAIEAIISTISALNPLAILVDNIYPDEVEAQ